MVVSRIVTSIDWTTVYNSIVLTVIAISQIYLDFAIIASQRRAARERKLQLAKDAALAREAVERQASGEHSAV